MYFFFFFPVGTDARTERFPRVTTFLVGSMLGIFAIRHTDPELYSYLLSYAFRPSNPTLPGALLSQFLHGNWMHVTQNTLYLWIFGKQLEGKLGFVPLLLILFPPGLLSCWIQLVATSPDSAYFHVPMVGASGAIAALLGATMVRFRHQRVRILYFLFAFLGGMTRGGVVLVNTVLACLFWFALQVIYGMVHWTEGTSVAYAAHAGGFIGGVITAILLGFPREVQSEIHREKGRRHFEAGDWHAAIGELTDQLKLFPHDEEARSMRARANLVLGRVGEASTEYLHLFRSSLERKEYDRLADLYEQMRTYAIGTNLDESELFAVAFEFKKRGYYAEAAEAFRELATRYPDGPKVQLARMRRAELLEVFLDRVDDARRVYEELLRDSSSGEWARLAKERLASLEADANRAQELAIS